jgi:hypothetical protein
VCLSAVAIVTIVRRVVSFLLSFAFLNVLGLWVAAMYRQYHHFRAFTVVTNKQLGDHKARFGYHRVRSSSKSSADHASSADQFRAFPLLTFHTHHNVVAWLAVRKELLKEMHYSTLNTIEAAPILSDTPSQHAFYERVARRVTTPPPHSQSMSSRCLVSCLLR